MKHRSQYRARTVKQAPFRFLRPLVLALIAATCSGALGNSADGNDIDVGAFYFPGYHPNPEHDLIFGPGWTYWDALKATPPTFPGHNQPKVPTWGYQDESLPSAFEVKIDAAYEAGIDFMAFDWYYNEGHIYLEEALDNGFLKAPNRDKLKFCIHWCNHDQEAWSLEGNDETGWTRSPGKSTAQTYTPQEMYDITAYMIDHYFGQPNYYTMDGKPLFIIMMGDDFVNKMEGGGPEKAKEVLANMRQMAIDAGYKGITIFTACYHGDARDIGFDGWTSYNNLGGYPAPLGQPPMEGAISYTDAIESNAGYKLWQYIVSITNIPYYPGVAMGWDNTPMMKGAGWEWEQGYVLKENDPIHYRNFNRMAADFISKENYGALPKAIFVGAWNEWSEGHYLEPDTVFGYDYLKAVASVWASKEVDEFDSDTSVQWSHSNVEDFQVVDGSLSYKSTSDDPSHWKTVSIDASIYDGVEVRMYVSHGSSLGQISWDNGAGFEESQTQPFTTEPGEWGTYEIDLSAHPEWRGNVTALRIAPTTTAGVTIHIDYIVALEKPGYSKSANSQPTSAGVAIQR